MVRHSWWAPLDEDLRIHRRGHQIITSPFSSMLHVKENSGELKVMGSMGVTTDVFSVLIIKCQAEALKLYKTNINWYLGYCFELS